jgi:hypothetical protein
MRRRIPLLVAAASAAALAIAPAWGAGGNATDLKLHPRGFGEKSYASWKAQQGEADPQGSANQALYFQKMTSTVTNAAGIAVITGLEGTQASDLQGLEWQHRDDGDCGAGAPRWDVTVSNNGAQRTVFLGCAAAAHTAGDEPGWTRDTYDGPALQAQFLTGDVIDGLAIVFDEGNDVGHGFVYLDNISVQGNSFGKVWHSAADNGNTSS